MQTKLWLALLIGASLAACGSDTDPDECPATDLCLPQESTLPDECPTLDQGKFPCGDVQCNSGTEVCILQNSAQCPVFSCEPLPAGCSECDCIDAQSYCDFLTCGDQGDSSDAFMIISCDG